MYAAAMKRLGRLYSTVLSPPNVARAGVYAFCNLHHAWFTSKTPTRVDFVPREFRESEGQKHQFGMTTESTKEPQDKGSDEYKQNLEREGNNGLSLKDKRIR